MPAAQERAVRDDAVLAAVNDVDAVSRGRCQGILDVHIIDDAEEAAREPNRVAVEVPRTDAVDSAIYGLVEPNRGLQVRRERWTEELTALNDHVLNERDLADLR